MTSNTNAFACDVSAVFAFVAIDEHIGWSDGRAGAEFVLGEVMELEGRLWCRFAELRV